MSLTTHREEIAAAANVVDVVDAYPRFVSGAAAGTCYPRWERTDVGKFGDVHFWNVVVVLPQDPADAEQWIEDHVGDLRAQLAPVMRITTVTPQRLDTGAGILPALFINGWKED